MSASEAIFLSSAMLIFWTYLGYPVFAWLLARVFARPWRPVLAPERKVSLVIAAYNEAGNIGRRLQELLGMLDKWDSSSEIIVVSDGSTDGTDQVAAQIADPRLHVIRQATNLGKAAALNAGVAAAVNPIIIFADARQTWDAEAMEYLLAVFADPQVGAVSGDLVLRHQDGSLAGVGLYWKLEKWLRRNESLVFASVGVTGAICAVRRDLYVPLPVGTILDDVTWPLAVVMRGYRVIHEPRACAFDRLPGHPKDELRRKVRTLSGCLQLLQMRPGIIFPWHNRVWFAVICHKYLRLLVPWAMILALFACIWTSVAWLQVMLWCQVAVYGLGVTTLRWPSLIRSRLANALAALLVLNAAAFLAWVVFLTGRCGKSWQKVSYNKSTAELPVVN